MANLNNNKLSRYNKGRNNRDSSSLPRVDANTTQVGIHTSRVDTNTTQVGGYVPRTTSGYLSQGGSNVPLVTGGSISHGASGVLRDSATLHSSHSNKSFLIIVVCIVAMLCIGGVMSWYFFNKLNNVVDPIDSIKIMNSSNDNTLVVGAELNLVVEILPINIDDNKVIFKSDNEKVLSVNNFGRVKAMDVGSASVSVFYENSSKIDYFLIYVQNNTGPVDPPTNPSGPFVHMYSLTNNDGDVLMLKSIDKLEYEYGEFGSFESIVEKLKREGDGLIGDKPISLSQWGFVAMLKDRDGKEQEVLAIDGAGSDDKNQPITGICCRNDDSIDNSTFLLNDTKFDFVAMP